MSLIYSPVLLVQRVCWGVISNISKTSGTLKDLIQLEEEEKNSGTHLI